MSAIATAQSTPEEPAIKTAARLLINGVLIVATDGTADWLAKDYVMTSSEIGQGLGIGAEYRVAEVADRNAGVV